MIPFTTRLNCCNLIPCTTAKLPKVRITRIEVTVNEGRQRTVRNHRGTLTRVRSDKQPAKTGLGLRKRQSNRGRHQKDHIHRIGETLLVFGILRPAWIEGASVVSGLNFARDLRAVRITMMQQ